ncbi:MAG: hypothetical protein HY903_08125 [Deltaproteobacteria bacterium]|nr:hypothetical protein [Deltaproteobacteria bacterium]
MHRLSVLVAFGLFVWVSACGGNHERAAYLRTAPGVAPSGAREDAADAKDFPVPPPPFSEGVFPCSQCHADMTPDLEVRDLGEHDGIELHHGPRDRWCFDCHNPDNRDMLRLASGRLVPFSESYRLCGQCHGDKYRDWRMGVHGKRSGEWNGKKQYLLCAHCHNPHAPRFKPLAPLPPPKRPDEIL